jgi:hypothetical protein
MSAARFRPSGTVIPIRICAAMLEDRVMFHLAALRNGIEGTVKLLPQPFTKREWNVLHNES